MNEQTPDTNESRWWISEEGIPTGPFPESEILERLETGTVTLTAYACPEGSEEWKRLAEWSQFERVDPTAKGTPPSPPPDTPRPQDSSTGEGNDEAATGITSVVASSEETTDESVVGMIIGGIVLGVIALIWFVGWGAFFTGVLWLIVIVGGLASLFFGIASSQDEVKDDRDGGIIIAGICGVIAFGAWFFIPTDDASRSTTQITANTATNDPALTATVEYWNAWNAVVTGPGDRIESQTDVVRAFLKWAERIEVLPTKDVDPVAVEWGLELAASLRQVASLISSFESERQQSVMRSLLHAVDGNIIGGLIDIANTAGEIDKNQRVGFQHLEYVLGPRLAKVRAQLTEKYDVQF